MKKIITLLACLTISYGSFAEIQPEKTPSVAQLPAEYPETWLFAHDANFNSLIAGKVIIVDVAAESREYKGAIGAAQFGTFIESSTRSEMYVGETFYSRGTTGERTDFVSIYDKQTLNKTGEVALPGGKRGQYVTNKHAMQLVDDDRYLLVFNFTPASSVTIVDTKSREILNEISVPGCSMIYPSGPRGFSSLCGNGSMMSVQFDENGKETGRVTIEPFFDVDADPIFDKPTCIGSTAYFVSYLGKVYPVDMSGAEPRPLPAWTLVSYQEQRENWRPSGWQIVTDDEKGGLYVIMQPDGYDGSHKYGGQHIWVADTASKTVTRKFEVDDAAFSLEFVPGSQPLLAVTNVSMGLDVYEPDGVLVRSISLGDAAMPLALHHKR